jgi:hypothetical protein
VIAPNAQGSLSGFEMAQGDSSPTVALGTTHRIANEPSYPN